MKLPDFLLDAPLNTLRTRMGAVRLGNIQLRTSAKRLTLAELETLVSGGIDIGSLDDVRVLPDGSLAYKDRRVMLYIRDVSVFGNRERSHDRQPRYHVANCQTLRDMRDSNRIERYVVAARDDGQFQVNFIRDRQSISSSLLQLKICQNCLAHLGWDGFGYHLTRESRAAIVARFSPKAFFEKFARDLLDSNGHDTEQSAPLNGYTDDFREISTSLKRNLGYRCEGCNADMSAPPLRKHLHVHHRNGKKHDNRRVNLIALCLGCHANEPGHAHLRNTAEFVEFQRLRGIAQSPST